MGRESCRKAMIKPCSDRASIFKTSGNSSSSVTQLWYSPTSNGDFKSLNRPFPSSPSSDQTTLVTLPCFTSSILLNSPPKCSTIACKPRHTPRIGFFWSIAVPRISINIGASEGIPGPGDNTTPSNPEMKSRRFVLDEYTLRLTSPALNTLTSAPARSRSCARFQVNES